MKKILFYSHDTYGLGNIRRTLSICQALMTQGPNLSILIVSGSPMIQSFRIPRGVDYVKLPCLTRSEQEGYTAKFLEEHPQDLINLRSDMILCTTANFKPDLIIVDKKPFGVRQELQQTLAYVNHNLPNTPVTLILRDILDSPDSTRQIWTKAGYFEAIIDFYAHVFILGCPTVFDPRTEYGFPPEVKKRVQFCGYIQREPGRKSPQDIRDELGMQSGDRFVLVTAGGGEDGSGIFETYLSGVRSFPLPPSIKTLMIFGPEMPEEHRDCLRSKADSASPQIKYFDFTDDLMSYIQAADLVVSMGGYGTVCEILSADKRAILIPRVHPVKEQAIRAQRLAKKGIVHMIHPESLSPQRLMKAVLQEINTVHRPANGRPPHLDLNGLSCVTTRVITLLRKAPTSKQRQHRGTGARPLLEAQTPTGNPLPQIP